MRGVQASPARRRPVRVVVADNLMQRDSIEWPMRLPSGELGLRWTGHYVLIRVNRELEVTVRSPSSDREIARAIVHLGSLHWIERGEELSDTAREMVEAAVCTHVLRVVRDAWAWEWPTPRQRFEVRS